MSNPKMFEFFPDVSEKEWLAKINNDLKGKLIQDVVEEIEPGLFIHPAQYPGKIPNDFQAIASHTPLQKSWKIGAQVNGPAPEIVNQKALELLSFGVNALFFDLSDQEYICFDTLLKDIEWQFIDMHFNVKTSPEAFWNLLSTYLKQYPKLANQCSGSVSFASTEQTDHFPKENPIGFRGISIQEHTPNDIYSDSLADILLQTYKIIGANLPKQVTPEALAAHHIITTSVDTNFFISIAKIRALKILLANFWEGYGIEELTIPITVKVNLSNRSKDTLYNTIFEATSMAMSAIIGGANTVIINNPGNNELDRLYTNIHHILLHESHLEQVMDPSAGSYYIEAVTNALAQRAWKKFQDSI